MKKVVFITGAMGRGGAERVISILGNYYASLGWNVSILMLLHSNIDYALDKKIQVIDLSDDAKRAVTRIPALIKNVRKYIKNNKPDVVVSFMGAIALISGLACKGLKVKHITSERNDPSEENVNPIFQKIRNNIYATCSACVLQTKRVYQYFPKKVQKNSVIIPNPVSVERYAKDEKAHKIVTAGRLEPQKNQQMLIEAFAEINKKHPEYFLEIFGEGKLKEALQQKICELNLSDKVFLKGNVLNIHEQIADAEIFVLPSNFEGLSNALLEAMMMGLACISTNCAGSDEAITDGENGILINTGDTKGLINAMKLLISNKGLSKKIAENAKKTAKNYYVDNVVEQWRKVIEN